jgi:hypothetical protein
MEVRTNGIEFGTCTANLEYMETGLIDSPLTLQITSDDPKRFARLIRTVIKQTIRTGLQPCLCYSVQGGCAMIMDKSLVEPHGCIPIVWFDLAKARTMKSVYSGIMVCAKIPQRTLEDMWSQAAAEWKEQGEVTK